MKGRTFPCLKEANSSASAFGVAADALLSSTRSPDPQEQLQQPKVLLEAVRSFLSGFSLLFLLLVWKALPCGVLSGGLRPGSALCLFLCVV